MFDAAYLPDPAPDGYDIAAGYLDAPGAAHVWTIGDWARASAAVRWLLPIATCWPPFGDAAADALDQARQLNAIANGLGVDFPVGFSRALDVEASIAQAAHDSGYVSAWCAAVKNHGDGPVIYTSAAYGHLFVGGAELWLADWRGGPHLLADTVATQYSSPVTNPSLAVDESLVIDGLPLWATRNAPPDNGGHPVPEYVDLALTPSGRGYWIAAADGAVFSFGDAKYHGGMNQPGRHLNAPIVGIVSTPSGKGYVMVGGDGGVFCFGDAEYHGSIPGLDSVQHLAAPSPELAAAQADAAAAMAADGHPNVKA